MRYTSIKWTAVAQLLLVSIVQLEMFSSNFECTHRFEFRHELQKRSNGCKAQIKENALCATNFTVAYSNAPPYVYFDKVKGKVVGILPTMLELALESCCFGCNHIQYLGPYNHIDRFFIDNVSFAMPVQTSSNTRHFFNHDHINMLDIQRASFLGPAIKTDPQKMGKTVLKAILGTWPLFITAFVMAATAGVCVWVLDTHWNRSEFPSTFPRGPFEGFWWAFISMTTVGYGDRSPKSTIARLFAVIWIMVGITIFSMYTASLSSAFTSALISMNDVSMYQKKVGIMNTSSIGFLAAMGENSVVVGFETLEEITEAIMKNEVEGVVLDDHTANYYVETMKEHGIQDITLYERVPISGCSYGIMSYNKTNTLLFKSFFDSNNDQRDVMASIATADHKHGSILTNSLVTENIFFSSNTSIFMVTIFTLVAISAAATAVAMLVKYTASNFKVFKDCLRSEQGEVLIPVNDLKEDEKFAEAIYNLNKFFQERKHGKKNRAV